MDLNDIDIHVLGENVKRLHGDHVYTVALHRALAMASSSSCRTSEVLSNGDVLAAARTEFLKLLRPH